MKQSKSILLAVVLLIVVAALYRVWEGRPFGFAPHLALAIFGGAMIRNKKLALLLPVAAILFSDLLYHLYFLAGKTDIPGFYEGQWQLYILYIGLTVFGFLLSRPNALKIAGFGIAGSMIFFLVSNFLVWMGAGGLGRPKTFEGLIMVYGDGLAFYRDYGLIQGFAGNLFLGDLFFLAILFGSYHLLTRKSIQPATLNR